MEMVEEENSKPFPANEPKCDLYTIPSSTIWFSWDEIHETEKTYLKEFFDGSSISRTQKVYKEYRDFIIKKYREDPSRELTFTEIRKSLIGDVSVMHKVFIFLEKWGLINFSSPSLPANLRTTEAEDLEERVEVKLEEGAPNGIRVVSVPNSLKVASLQQNANEVVESVDNSFKLPPLASYSDVFGDLKRQKGLICGTCGEDCASGFYESQKQEGLVICVKCFKDHGESKSVDDFMFPDSKVSQINHGANAWTDAETLLLLESVLNHGDEWDLLVQHVRTKTKSDCISRLLELPFGEVMLDMAYGKCDERNSSGDTGNIKMHESTSVELQDAIKEENPYHEQNEIEQTGEDGTDEPPLKRRRIAPSAYAGSSLLKQVAVLSTAMGSHITAAAAEAAVTAIKEENPYARMVFEGEDNDVTNDIISHLEK